jgi:hypothetical protein
MCDITLLSPTPVLPLSLYHQTVNIVTATTTNTNAMLVTSIFVLFNNVSFRSILQSFQANACIVPQLGHEFFLPDPFQFIINHSSYHSTLYSLDIVAR